MRKYNSSKLRRYLTLTFLITWSFWGLLIILTNSNIMGTESIVYRVLLLIGGFGPTISALINLEEDRSNLTFHRIKNFVFTKRKNSRVYLLVFCLLIFFAIYLPSRQFNPEVNPIIFLIIWIVMTFLGGGNEELGWRGIMQPMLEEKHGYIKATLITGVVWAIWHLPMWFIKGDSHSEMSFLIFALTCVPISTALAGLYKASNSVFYAMILHGFINTVTAIVVIDYNIWLAITIVTVIIFSSFIWFRLDKKSSN